MLSSRIRIGSFKQCSCGGIKSAQMFGYDRPQYFRIDAPVFVPQEVPEPMDLLPRDFGMGPLHGRRQMLGGFGNDQETMLDGPLHPPTLSECRKSASLVSSRIPAISERISMSQMRTARS